MRKADLQTLARLCHVSLSDTRAVTGYSVDSRLVVQGNIFFALKGARVDSHDLLGDVANAGAIAAVVSKSYYGPSYGLALIAVDDVLQALQTIARHFRAESRAQIVAVTGSVGKTTTKDFLKVLLGTQFKVVASPGNSNSQVGLPLTLLNHTDGSEEVLVLEMGMTLPGHIANLITIAPPDIALITTAALVHAGNFSSLEAIAHAKGEIFGSSKTRLGILPREIAAFDELKALGTCVKKSFSTQRPDADYFLRMENGELNVVVEERSYSLDLLQVAGTHNRHNLLAAITVAAELHVPWNNISDAIRCLKLPERRLETVDKQGIRFINDSYNAPPIGVRAALDSLPDASGGRYIAVLGTMPELGKFSQQCHQEIGEHALKCVDRLFCLGEECLPMVDVWRRAGRPVQWFQKREDLAIALRSDLQAGDVVLIKGANTKQMWKLLDEWE